MNLSGRSLQKKQIILTENITALNKRGDLLELDGVA